MRRLGLTIARPSPTSTCGHLFFNCSSGTNEHPSVALAVELQRSHSRFIRIKTRHVYTRRRVSPLVNALTPPVASNMVSAMQMHHSTVSQLNCNNINKCGIRSGMSVQVKSIAVVSCCCNMARLDRSRSPFLCWLICQELKYLTAQRQRREFWARMSTLQMAVAADDTGAYSLPSTCSSSLSPSPPPRYYRNGACYSEIYGRAPLSNRQGFASDKMFVTRGGQVVSLLAGVVNAPPDDV